MPPWRTGESAVEAKPPSGTRAREPPWLLLTDIDVDAKAKGLKRKASEAEVPDIMSEVSADNEGDAKSQGKWKKECLRLAKLILNDKWDDAEVKANALFMWPNSNH